jgi:alpha-mannosidase
MKQIFLILIFLIPSVLFGQDVPLKRLYLGNDTHVDLMYNGTEERWSQLILDMADFYLKLGEQTSKEKTEIQSKWNYDCAYWLWVLEHKTSPEYFQRIIAQLKNQQASVPYNFTLPIYGASTAESVLRSFYYGGYLERKFGIDVDLAVCQENATIPLGLTSLWAGSGAKYSWKGVCNCATKTLTKGVRNHEIYWCKGLDNQKVLMKWYSNFGWNAELGGYSEMLEPTLAVIQMDTMTNTKRYPYRIAGAFGRGWDNMINYAYDMQWGVNHRTRPGTKVFLSNELDFFKDFENTYGKKLPSETLAYGNEWDLLPASLMNVSGGIRRSMEELRNAEAMAAIVSKTNPNAFDNLKDLKKDAFFAVSVISAHGWTIDGPITKPQFTDWARIQTQRIKTYTNQLTKQSAELLAAQIQKISVNESFFAFNSLNWYRNDVVDYAYDKSKNIVVKSLETSQTVPHQFITKNNVNYLRIFAENIPSVGYKVFEIINNQPIKRQNKLFFKQKGNVFETNLYKITIANSGAIISLIEKKSGKEFAKKTNDRYLIDMGGALKEGKLELENVGEVSFTIKATSSSNLKHVSSITLFKKSPRIQIENQINQNFGKPEYWSYSFDINQPEVWHEEVGAVIKAKYSSQGGHYADQMSRVDHLSLNHFVNVSNANQNVTISDLDCLFMKLGNSESQKLDTASAQINVLIGGQIDENLNLGVKKQGGDSLFLQNYALLPQVGVFNQTDAMKFALEHQNPIVSSTITGGKLYSGSQYSFLKTDNKDLILWTLKPGEDGGVAARFWSMAQISTETNVIFTESPTSATNATHVETPINKLEIKDKTIKLNSNQQQMKTILIKF